MNNKYDSYNAHLAIYAGAGGDDAKDWADMLFRMYFRFCEKKGWKVLGTDERGIQIGGTGVYGQIKNEMGVHRLVRISPFSQKKLRHTSFALVEITPILPVRDFSHLKIPEDDLRVELFRSSGPGGQNVNKRETAVRVIHVPTGLVAASQNQRSQEQNRDFAMALLKSKLVRLMEEKRETELSNLRIKVTPDWGNQIRSYVLHPYQQVKDHRTGEVSHQPDKVLDGELDAFILAELSLEG